jgi:protein TonB
MAVPAAVLFLGLGSLRAQEVRIPETEAKKAAVTRVDPEYPPMAKQMRLSGRVQVDVHIDEHGNVEKTEGVNGNPILTGAASNCLKKWKFTPVMAGGKATKAVATLTFDFKM